MPFERTSSGGPPSSRVGASALALLVLTVPALGGCGGGGGVQLPPARPLVIFSGARITVDAEEMEEVHEWVTDAVETIEEDPSFLVERNWVPEPRYPWETLDNPPGDTVRIAHEQSAPDAETSYLIYAFLHQLREMDRLVEWFPETEFMEGFELERFMVARTADSWLLGRAIFDTHPYRPLDEIVYADDAGLLDAFLLHERGEEFPEARERYVQENPDGFERFEAWYRETFGEDPRGS